MVAAELDDEEQDEKALMYGYTRYVSVETLSKQFNDRRVRAMCHGRLPR